MTSCDVRCPRLSHPRPRSTTSTPSTAGRNPSTPDIAFDDDPRSDRPGLKTTATHPIPARDAYLYPEPHPSPTRTRSATARPPCPPLLPDSAPLTPSRPPNTRASAGSVMPSYPAAHRRRSRESSARKRRGSRPLWMPLRQGCRTMPVPQEEAGGRVSSWRGRLRSERALRSRPRRRAWAGRLA